MRTVGRPGVEALDDEDIEHVEELLRPTRIVPHLQSIKETHHNLARILATGATRTEAAEQAGFTISRVSTLMADPTFKELVEGYRVRATEIHEEEFRGARKMAAKVVTQITRMIADEVEIADNQDNRSLDDKPIIPLGRLESLLQTLGDRTILPKQSVNVQVDGDSLAERMAAARARLEQQGERPPRVAEALPPPLEPTNE